MKCIYTKGSHLNEVAHCHMSAFPEALSTRLGKSFCLKMLSWYVVSERCILFHLTVNNEIVGYCGGLMNRIPGQAGSTTSMIQYNFRSLAINFLARPWLLFHHEIRKNIPLIIKNLKLRLLRQKFRNKDVVDNSWKDFVPSMGLVVIGVSPEHQGKGYGTLLLKEFELRAQEEGFRKMHLSVRKNNNQAIAVYRKNGWQICNEGSEEYLMHKNLA